MSETALWLIYASAAVPAFLLRHFGHFQAWLCCVVAAIWAAVIWTIGGLAAGGDISDPWFGIGVVIAAGFGGVFGLVGTAIAIWRNY